MAKGNGKNFTSSKKEFVKGGASGKMFGKTKAGTQKPGTSATASRKPTSWPGKLGGNGKMFGKQTSKPSKSCC